MKLNLLLTVIQIIPFNIMAASKELGSERIVKNGYHYTAPGHTSRSAEHSHLAYASGYGVHTGSVLPAVALYDTSIKGVRFLGNDVKEALKDHERDMALMRIEIKALDTKIISLNSSIAKIQADIIALQRKLSEESAARIAAALVMSREHADLLRSFAIMEERMLRAEARSEAANRELEDFKDHILKMESAIASLFTKFTTHINERTLRATTPTKLRGEHLSIIAEGKKA